jgi:8-amino-7-oxononanoate synthase
MADFTSSLYLDMRHPSDGLPGWAALTTGRPAALGTDPGASPVAVTLATLVGAERATLARSTLHALGDCLEVLARRDAGLVVDSGVYPVGRWAVQRAVGLGVPLRVVPHHGTGATVAAVRGLDRRGLRAVVVADGLCTGCGRPYPLTPVAAAVRRYGGTVLLDDTQAVGLLGADPGAGAPYGRGGGGSVRHAGSGPGSVVTVASLAKAFGAPVACVAGPAGLITELRTTGSAVHSSPPSAVDVAAAAAALARNAVVGDELRARLVARVRALRSRTAEHGLVLVGGLFPVQSTTPVPADVGRRLLSRLAAGGVHAVLRRTCDAAGTAVTLVISTAHRRSEVERAGTVLGAGWRALDGPVRRAR